MFGLFESKEKGELALVFDLRSSVVSGAVVELRKNTVPKILFSTREYILGEDKTLDADRFFSVALQALDRATDRLLKARLGAPKKIFCVLASPWHIAQTRIINYKKDKPFVFSLKLADELIKKEVEAFKSEHIEPHQDTKNALRLMELRNIKTTLNGYATHKPLDQKAEEAEITLFVSVSPEHVLKEIEDTIKKYFHSGQVRFASSTIAYFGVLRNMFPAQEDFLIIDIGGELTDITMIKKDVLRESISFPLGTRFVTRSLASLLKVREGEAESYFSLLEHGHADARAEKKLQPMLEQIRGEWLKKFQESLANISQDISVPYHIYLSTDSDSLEFFKSTILAEQFNQYTLTQSKFEVVGLDTKTLHGIADFNNEVVPDPFILVDSSYINHFIAHPEESGLI